MVIGNRIRRARDLARLTQTGLAAAVGVQRSAVAQWEQGKSHPTSANMIQLATVCEVRFEWLATGRGAMRIDDTLQPSAAVMSEFAYDLLEVRMLHAIRRISARRREAIVEMIEKLGH